ncbi:malectin domain-containing carbohydrate-binding protein [Granulicella sp. S156]|uniref:malectin domain-containing carbohydrate-binding protein n=1 Tax=Granulicella sp. S156 TaxID=1747224 RepID=UPI0020B15E8E|nr:malectin domain-containing carbohydrate-binding protein [Granulicella sp. S156]
MATLQIRTSVTYDLELKKTTTNAVVSVGTIQEQEDMPETLTLSPLDAEHAELEAVTKAIARYPRLSHLALYLGEMYFSGKSDEINEYNIATEVIGRSKTAFDASQDAIARVEIHRLRKKLKEFYETDGRNHLVKLSIPVGTYIPVFVHRAEESPATGVVRGTISEPSVQPSESGDWPPEEPGQIGNRKLLLRFMGRGWLYGLGFVVLVLVAFGAYRQFHSESVAKAIIASTRPALLPSAPQPVSSSVAFMPIRLIAGYSGSPQIDSTGTSWKADEYFHGGDTWIRPVSDISRTSDPALFRQWRKGDFTYDIPLPPGVYELHLYFVASEREGDGLATFTIAINGEKVLQNFDVVTDALGENIADERIFRDVSPARDGMLHLSFASERGVPTLNALEVLQGTPHKQLPIHLLTELTPFTDHNGNLWRPDTYFVNGKMSVQRHMAEGSTDPGLYAAERYGHFTYAIPVDTRGRYTVVLHFAEFYFGSEATGAGGVGSRVFRVLCNGTTLLDDFDIFKEAGSLHALTRTFYHLKPTAQGKLNLTFEPIANYATVSGIEVLDESQ